LVPVSILKDTIPWCPDCPHGGKNFRGKCLKYFLQFFGEEAMKLNIADP
jgi:hypothetical protein